MIDKNKEGVSKPITGYRMIKVKKGNTDGGYSEIRLPDRFVIKPAKVLVKRGYILSFGKE